MSTQSNAPRFSSWFPLNCPPAAAADADGIVFRFVAKDPVDAEDFLSYHELRLALHSDPCRRCALSVYKSLDVVRDQLRDLRKRNPKRAERHIARDADACRRTDEADRGSRGPLLVVGVRWHRAASIISSGRKELRRRTRGRSHVGT